jgi:hypothetical protein
VSLDLENKEPTGFVKIFLLFVSIIGAQRFLLTPLDALVCFVPLVIAVIYFNKIELRNTLILFALFISIDNAPEELTITFGVLRYTIYLFALFVFYRNRYYNPKYVFIFFFFLFLFGGTTILNFRNIHGDTLIRDLFIVVLAFPILCSDKRAEFEINFSILNKLIVVYILSEVINVFLRPKLGFSTADYLSYISTKSFVVLPSFYYLIKGKLKIAIPLILLTIFVLVAYGTRMIILTYVLGLILYFINSGILQFRSLVFALIVFIAIYYVSNVLNIEFAGFKATGVFIQLLQSGSLGDKFLLIDPVRYYETKLFFERNFFEICFGNGFGSGLIDVKNELNFVKVTDSAFSLQELNQGKYYNLHDTWIDLGLRFGFVAILSVYFFIFRWMIFLNNMSIKFIGFAMLVLFSCATYSTQGLILIGYLFFYAKCHLNNPKVKFNF